MSLGKVWMQAFTIHNCSCMYAHNPTYLESPILDPLLESLLSPELTTGEWKHPRNNGKKGDEGGHLFLRLFYTSINTCCQIFFCGREWARRCPSTQREVKQGLQLPEHFFLPLSTWNRGSITEEKKVRSPVASIVRPSPAKNSFCHLLVFFSLSRSLRV